MYPYLTLKIKNHIPQIFFYPDKEMSRQLTHEEESINETITQLAQKLDLLDSDIKSGNVLERILEITSEADNTIFEKLPSINVENLEFELNQTLNRSLEAFKDLEDEYKDIEMSSEVRNELVKNRKSDILASLVEQVYDILIAKILLAAYELEITCIHLECAHNYARFTEKMGNELQKLGLEFIID